MGVVKILVKIRNSHHSDEMALENYDAVLRLILAALPSLWYLNKWDAAVDIVHKRRRLVEDVALVGGRILPFRSQFFGTRFFFCFRSIKKNDKRKGK